VINYHSSIVILEGSDKYFNFIEKNEGQEKWEKWESGLDSKNLFIPAISLFHLLQKLS